MIETSVKSTVSFNTKDTFKTDSGSAVLYRLDALEKQGVGDISRLPFSIRVLLEALLRTEDGFEVTADDVLPIGMHMHPRRQSFHLSLAGLLCRILLVFQLW